MPVLKPVNRKRVVAPSHQFPSNDFSISLKETPSIVELASINPNYFDPYYHDSLFHLFFQLTVGNALGNAMGMVMVCLCNFFHAPPRQIFLTGKLQYRQGSVYYLQCALWPSKSPQISFLWQPFGHTILQNLHFLWCSSCPSCRPSQVHPSFTHLIFILLIVPSTI